MDVDNTVIHGLWTLKYLLTSINFGICVLCNEIHFFDGVRRFHQTLKGVRSSKILRTHRLQKEEN